MLTACRDRRSPRHHSVTVAPGAAVIRVELRLDRELSPFELNTLTPLLTSSSAEGLVRNFRVHGRDADFETDPEHVDRSLMSLLEAMQKASITAVEAERKAAEIATQAQRAADAWYIDYQKRHL